MHLCAKRLAKEKVDVSIVGQEQLPSSYPRRSDQAPVVTARNIYGEGRRSAGGRYQRH